MLQKRVTSWQNINSFQSLWSKWAFKLGLGLLLLSGYGYSEEPWGTDSALLESPFVKTSGPCDIGAETIIQFHQSVLSPADGPRSHYIPSSSSYTLQAIQKYGLFTGFSMGCDRLMRENSEAWIYRSTITRDGDVLKLDPVP